MQSVSVGATPTVISPASNRAWVALFNNSSQTVYLQFDGSATVLTTSNGFPLLPNQAIFLENDLSGGVGPGQPLKYTGAVNGIVASGTADVRVQSP